MYELYYSPGAASFAVHWLLVHLNVPHTLHLVNIAAKEHKTPQYLALNPDGLVPLLLIDGKPHTECAALLLTLADRHPTANMAPSIGSPGRIDYYQWTLYCANGLQPAFRYWFYPHEAAGAGSSAAAQDQARVSIEKKWDRINAHLGDGRTFMLGEKLSAVDLLATMIMRWSRKMPKPATDWPAINGYVQRMRALPSFKTLNAREGITEWL